MTLRLHSRLYNIFRACRVGCVAKLCRLAILAFIAWNLMAQSSDYIVALLEGPEYESTFIESPSGNLSANCKGECWMGALPSVEMSTQWYCPGGDQFTGEANASACTGPGCTTVSGHVLVIGDANNTYYPGEDSCDIASFSYCDGSGTGQESCGWTCN